jgi:hypothetical protein
MQVEVGIDESDVLAPCGEKPQLDGIALSHVPVVMENPHFRMAGRKGPFSRVVDGPVGNNDQFVRDAGRGKLAPDDLDVLGDEPRAVEDRRDHREQRAALRGAIHRARGVDHSRKAAISIGRSIATGKAAARISPFVSANARSAIDTR